MRFYHVSEVDLDGKTVVPSIPRHWLVSRGYENGDIERISCAPTIDQCLVGLCRNLKGKTLYVHEPVTDDFVFLSNDTIREKEYVPDASMTEEMWILQPVEMQKVMTIYVEQAYSDPFLYEVGPEKKEIENYQWHWKCIKQEKRKNQKKGTIKDENRKKNDASLHLWKRVDLDAE